MNCLRPSTFAGSADVPMIHWFSLVSTHQTRHRLGRSELLLELLNRRRGKLDTVPTTLAVITNEDDALLVWSIDAPIPECRGFAIARRRQTQQQANADEKFLDNRIGFEGDTISPGETKASTEWPFQRFSWTDHEADTGDTVSYEIVPVIQNAAGKLDLLQSAVAPHLAEYQRWAPGTGLRFRDFAIHGPFPRRTRSVARRV